MELSIGEVEIVDVPLSAWCDITKAIDSVGCATIANAVESGIAAVTAKWPTGDVGDATDWDVAAVAWAAISDRLPPLVDAVLSFTEPFILYAAASCGKTSAEFEAATLDDLLDVMGAVVKLGRAGSTWSRAKNLFGRPQKRPETAS